MTDQGQSKPAARSPLEGLRVYDSTMGIAGPHCAELLAMCGAEVIKVEPPDGDWCRAIGQQFGGMGSHFLTYNRGKKSIVLDLRNPEGRKLAARIASSCDIVLESFRPGVMKRLGLGYEELSASRPELIYVAVSGFGQTGPYASLPAFDTLLQAFSGWMSLNRDARGVPVLMDHIAVDVLTGLYAFQACCTALISRFRFGTGAFVEANLMQAAAAFLAPKLTEHILADGNPVRLADAPMGVWPTKEGILALLVKDQPQFAILCEIIGRPEFAADARFASRELRMQNAVPLSDCLAPALMQQSAAFWEAALREKGLTGARVRGFSEFLADEHVRAVNVIRPFHQPGLGSTPLISVPGLPFEGLSSGAPRLGEHTSEILAGIGCSPDEISTLLKTGLVGAPTA